MQEGNRWWEDLAGNLSGNGDIRDGRSPKARSALGLLRSFAAFAFVRQRGSPNVKSKGKSVFPLV
jgi:hypothetical protein